MLEKGKEDIATIGATKKPIAWAISGQLLPATFVKENFGGKVKLGYLENGGFVLGGVNIPILICTWSETYKGNMGITP